MSQPSGEFPLGRVEGPSDPRDANYPMTLRLATVTAPVPPSRYWWPGPLALNQGSVGACVGFTGANWMQNRPIKTPVSNLTGLNLYAECKKIDGLPPNVEGTYARCLLEVLRAQKRVARYLWATSPDDIKMWVLSTGPVLVGTPWYSGMFTPDPNGFVKPTGSVVGGHEYLVRGYSRPLKAFRCRNSWGNSWGIGRGVKWAGDGGEFWIDETTLYDLIWKQWGDAIGIEEARA